MLCWMAGSLESWCGLTRFGLVMKYFALVEVDWSLVELERFLVRFFLTIDW